MPKKMGTNTKAVEARERKNQVKKQNQEKAEKEKEDALWQDDDKNLQKKLQRKKEEEEKKMEMLRKKAEKKALLENELNSINTSCTAKVSASKVTRAQIDQEIEKRNKNIESINNPQKPAVPKVAPIEENLNRVMFDTHVAQTVEQAISVLKVSDEAEDRHPEKRMKAAYKAFEDKELARLKKENPTLKLSQLKQIVFKSWQRSPENPMNNLN